MKSNFFSILFVGLLLIKILQEGVEISWFLVAVVLAVAFVWPWIEPKILHWVYKMHLRLITLYFSKKRDRILKGK